MLMPKRPRRLRENPVLRAMVRETRMAKSALIYPLFVKEGTGIKEPIPSLEGQYYYSPDRVHELYAELCACGIGAVLFFGLPAKKDAEGSGAWNDQGAVQQAMRVAKQDFPQLYLISDVCMCEYTSHGHCGVLDGCTVDNDKTLELLTKTALSHVRAGADMVAPSDMMDGRIGAIRSALDAAGFCGIPIMSYAAKYASAFYGPFRDAADSAPSCGDRRGYQMDCHNRREALKETLLDIEEGADLVMVKPAMNYLDVIREVYERVDVPVAAYSVSGEYAMVKTAAAAGLIDEAGVVCEMAVSAFRAGAGIYITYYAKELAKWMDEGRIG